MPYSEPTNLGVIACPGGATFAEEVITHLRRMYKHRFSLKNDVISKRYNLDKDTLIQDINYRNDLSTSDLVVKGTTDKYRPPVFKINTQSLVSPKVVKRCFKKPVFGRRNVLCRN